jgi:2-desacetyl-2-hydroxyethyl bacteriochlorophyllide A dehydrogenase
VNTERARAFWIAAPGRGEIREETLPPSTDREILVRARYSGISRGTEALIFNGSVPATEYQRMRAPFQAGEFPGPVKYGYASVGEVEQGPDEWMGRRIFSLYPHQTRYVIPADAAYPLPDDVPSSRAVLAANLETAVNGVWDARPHIGDRLVVVGAGTVGCLTAWVAKHSGCDVHLVDVNPARAAIASQLGLTFALPAEAPRDADTVIHASGAPEGLDLACRLAATEATIVEMSWYGTRVVPLPLGEAFHARRLTLKSSQVGQVAASQRARWDFRRRMTFALSLLADPALDALITGESDFQDLPRVMAALAGSPGDTLCHRIRY